MGVAYNPRIVTDGLVACYDLGNTRRSYSPNVHPGSTNIYDWYVGIRGNAGANQSTISKDTIESPVGNTPLRMDITGNDPHIGSYNNLQWNLGETSVGETWTVSVYAKASTNTTCQIFIFGINASGQYIEAPAGTRNITTEWQRIQFTHTFANSNTVYIQSRLDGPDTGGAGESIWFDGWQVERGSTTSDFTSDYTGGDVLDISKNSNNGTIVSSPQYNNSNGGYVTFDGTNDSIGIGATAGDLGIYDDSYTFEAWVYPTDISALSGDNFIFGTNVSSLREGLHLGFRNTNIHHGHYSADYVSGTVTANQWYHIVWTYDKNLGATNGTAKIYKNGQLQGNSGTINSFIGTTEIKIGQAFGSNPPHYQGRGSQFRIYNKALSSSEVLQNFNSQKVRYGTFENELTIVKDDLLLYYDSSNKNSYPGYGNVIYDIGSGTNTGTLQNGASYNIGGGYFDFDGVNDYISITDNLGNPQQFTVECWVYPTELDVDGNNNYRRLLTHSGASSNDYHSVLIEQGGNISFRIPGGSTTNFQASGFGSNINRWGHIVCTYDQNDRKIYFNGDLRGTTSEPNVNVDFGSPAIVSPGNVQTFKGRIANFRIYDKALSAAEVKQNYDATKIKFIEKTSVVKDSLILYLDAENVYSYDVGISTTTWNDIAGGRVGTLNNPSFNQNYFSFNGVDQNLVFPSSVEVSTAGFTMAFLMRVPSTQVNGVNWSFMLGDRDYGAGDYEIGIYSTNNTNFLFKENGSTPSTISTTLGEEWVYLVFGMTPSLNPFIYVNGEIRVRASSTFTSSILDFTHLFSSNTNTIFFKGDFSAVQLYDRELKPSEIKQNFNAFRERFGI